MIDIEPANSDYRPDFIHPALQYDISGLTTDHVDALIQSGKLTYWSIKNGAYLAGAVTGISNMFGIKTLVIVALGGSEMSKWFDEFMLTMDDYAELTGCNRMIAYGREGWVRQAKSYGWEYAYTAVKKEL